MSSIVNLTLKKSGFVNRNSADTVFPTNTSTWYAITDDEILFFGFNAMASNLRRKKLITCRLRAYCRTVSSYTSDVGFFASPNAADFDPATLTYNNKPAQSSATGANLETDMAPNTSADVWISPYYAEVPAAAADAIRYGIRFKPAARMVGQAYSKIRLAGGGLPYLEVTYDESVNITSKVSNLRKTPSGTQNPGIAASFLWDLIAANGHCADETWTQASAVFYWKKSTDSTWHSVNVSGASQQVTIPACTFQPSSTIQYYVQVTDTEGTTTQSSTETFTTTAATLTVYDLPSGSNVDTRNPRTITWTLKTGGTDYPQASATYYWRKTGESTWNSITVSGNTKRMTIPANTLPTGSTVEQYFSATPQGADPISLNPSTFTTPTTKITPIIYPSGRDVESGGPLSFTWAFRNSLGDYAQSAATLYWRASTSDPYQTIQASGSEQSITVPKNTFPGNGSTVYWYLEGTDIGGTTSTTSEQNFRTVTSKITPQDSPTSGYEDPRNAITFSWYFKTPAGFYDQASASFFWRLQGETSWTEVQDTGNAGSVTIPANTFPVANIVEWYLSGTDAGGCSSTSEVYSFSTTASTTYAIPVAPVGRVVDGTKPIIFSWIVQNSDGTDATRTILSWKLPTESQSEWHTLIDSSDPITEYTVPENTYNAGPVEWRVQAYNRDDVAGPAGEASFVVLRAPEAPDGLTATAVPRTTVRWQASGQEAYEVSIDGETVAKAFGPATYSYQQTIPLEDGVHEIRVRIQGAYGLWSNWAETSILVNNTPEGTLDLSGDFEIDAVLQISGEISQDTEIQWYRDGTRIGRTVGKNTFTDRLALGSHDYYAEIWHDSGNYTRSNTVTGITDVRFPVIAAAAGGAWLSLRLSDNSRRSESFNWSRTSSSMHIAGAIYPDLELSPFEDLTGSYDCAFRSQEEARAFEALRGKPVILKSRGGAVVVGGLTDLKKRVNSYYTAYTFSLKQIEWEDFADDAENS